MSFRNFDEMMTLLACPTCSSALQLSGQRPVCPRCNQRIGRIDQSVIFLSDQLPENFYAPEYTSSNGYSLQSLELIDSLPDGVVLDLGAGQPSSSYPNTIQIEIRKYRDTDIVFIGDRLPFRDNTVDGVISQAVLEHVRDPQQHVAEILRVLKPGGTVVLDGAFMQPLHGAPYHYFNSTYYAFAALFAEFSKKEIRVPPYLKPWVSLQWILRSYLQGLDSDQARDTLRSMTIGDLEKRFNATEHSYQDYKNSVQNDPRKMARWVDQTDEKYAEYLAPLLPLSPHATRELAAGFQAIATKGSSPVTLRSPSSPKKSWWSREFFRVPKKSVPDQIKDIEVLRIEQTDASQHCGELCAGVTVTRAFQLPDPVSRIDIMFATFMRKNTTPIEFILSDGAVKSEHEIRLTVSTAEITDNEFYSFRFPAFKSKNNNYLLTLRAPEGKPDNSVTARMGAVQAADGGDLTINGKKVAGDLTFRVFTQSRLFY